MGSFYFFNMKTSKILFEFGLAKILVIRIGRTSHQSSAIRLQRGKVQLHESSLLKEAFGSLKYSDSFVTFVE